MIIGLAVFSSIFAYNQSVKNSIAKKQHQKQQFLFLFFIVCLTCWEIINLFTLDLGVHYSLLYLLYLSVFVLIIFYFVGINIRFWINHKENWRLLINNLPVLIVNLFIFIIFLFFYHTKHTYDDDMWWTYHLMNSWQANITNHFNANIISSSAVYLPVGVYQWAASLNIYQRFYLMPYLTSFIFFFICNLSIYLIIDKYFKSTWKKNLAYLIFSMVILMFYFFYNFKIDDYPTIEGTWVSCTYPVLLSLPFFLYMNQMQKNYFFFIILALLFLNESSLSLTPIFLFSFLVICLCFRKQWQIKISFFITCFLFLLMSLYLTLNSISENAGLFTTEFVFKLIFAIPFASYLLMILSVLIIGLPLINRWKSINFISDNVIQSLWQSNFLNFKLEVNWFKKTNWWVKLSLIIISSFIIAITVFFFVIGTRLENSTYSLSSYTILCAAISFIVLVTTNIIIIAKWKLNPFYLFIIFYSLVCLVLVFIVYKVHFPEYIALRIQYSSFMIGSNYTLSIKNIIFCLLFIVSAYEFKVKYEFKPKWLFNKVINKHNLFAVMLAIFFIVVPACQGVINPGVIPNFALPTEIFAFGFSKKTINTINKYNFDNQLTFADFYLPAVNNNIKYNLGYGLYTPYSQLGIWYTNFSSKHFYLPTTGDWLLIGNHYQTFLANYSYICLKANDVFLIDMVNKMHHQFKLIDNVNNEVYIFKNINLNKELQDQFFAYNLYIGM